MHLLFRESHGLDETAPAEDLGQAPADLVVLSFSDSDLGAFAEAWRADRDGLPSLRLASLARLRHPLSVDLYCERTLSGAKGVLVRLLGGADYWRYGLQKVSALAAARKIAFAALPADGRPDPTLDAVSTLPVSTLRRLAGLCDRGGPAAARTALGQLALAAGLYAGPKRTGAEAPRAGFYRPGAGVACPFAAAAPDAAARGGALLVFYRAYLTAADLAPIDALAAALEARGLPTRAAFLASLKEPEAAAWLAGHVRRLAPEIVLNATAFSAAPEAGGTGPLEAAGAPVLQLALATAERAAWAGSARGLSAQDLAMHVALPEIDGRLFAGVASFKAPEAPDPDLGHARRLHAPEPERVAAIAEKAAARVRLARTPRAERRLALVLSTYPGRADQIAHAVGLDAPASAAAILHDLAEAGYDLGAAPPTDGAGVLAALTSARVLWPLAEYRAALAALPASLRAELEAAHGPAEADPDVVGDAIALPVARVGRLALALQPERGRTRDDRAGEYHDQRRPPRHAYVAFYLWLRAAFDAHALVHLGAHGTLEWLPGKAVALSGGCWPEALLGPLPVVYPFVVNDPGEAAMAKRRLGAVTLGHLTPPLREAATPARLAGLERLLDEYGAADGLDPARRERLAARILAQAEALDLSAELGLEPDSSSADTLAAIDAFVCDVKATQVTDGLHVFGRAPANTGPLAAPLDLTGAAAAERVALAAALDGRAVAPGPAGSPWRGRADVLPTGRNLYAIDPRATPTEAAWAEGKRLADLLVTRHLQDQGDWPRGVVVDLWGSASMRTAGAEFAMALALIGAEPEWDAGSGRVSGVTITPLPALGRPRIDVTLRVSGLFRDVFEGLPRLFEQALAALRARDEPAEENPYRAEAPAARAAADPRVFGPAPGAYGLDMGDVIDDLSDAAPARAAERWLAASAHSYGGAQDGASARPALERRVAAADAFAHAQDLPETDLFMAADTVAHEGGFAAAAAALGAAPALYRLDATRPDRPAVRSLREEAARVTAARATSPVWIAGQMRHGFRGAAEIAATLDQMAAYARLAGVVGSRQFDLYFDATLGDPAVTAFLAQANPAALAAMRARFEGLRDAGLWRPLRNSVAEALAAPEAAE